MSDLSYDGVIEACRRLIAKAAKKRTRMVYRTYSTLDVPHDGGWGCEDLLVMYKCRVIEFKLWWTNPRKSDDPEFHPGQTRLGCSVHHRRAGKRLVHLESDPCMKGLEQENWIALVEEALRSLEIKVLEQKRNNTW